MNCEEFSQYLIYCLPEFEPDLPVEARLHLQDCPKCKARCQELESAFTGLHHQMAAESNGQEDELLARVRERLQERLKRGDLPDEPDIDCQVVRPFLAQAADPLELITPPAWMEEHLAICEDCRGQLECLEQLSHIITVAEMPVLAGEVVADAPDAFLKRVYELRDIPPERITCDLASSYHHDMANCDLEVPAEIYRHVRHCASCKEQVQQLRHRLGVTIPEIGTPEFEELLSTKATEQPQPVREKVQPAKPSRMGAFLHRNWQKLTIGATAAIFIIAFLFLSPNQVMAVTFAQVCEAFAKMRYVYIDAPQEDYWYSKDPLMQITIRNDGTYSRFTAANGRFVKYNPKGELLVEKQYSGQKLQELVGAFQRDLDFRQNFGVSKFSKIKWTLLKQDVLVDGKHTNLYELIVNVGKPEDNEQKKYLVHVNESTGLPLRLEIYFPHWKTRAWELSSTIKYAYPDKIPEEILNPKFASHAQKHP